MGEKYTDDYQQDTLHPDLGCEVEQIAPVLSIAFEHLKNDVDNTCSVLGISTEPSKWTADDVKAWLLWTLRQYALPMISFDYFNMDGSVFVRLSEEDFQARAPQVNFQTNSFVEFISALLLQCINYFLHYCFSVAPLSLPN